MGLVDLLVWRDHGGPATGLCGSSVRAARVSNNHSEKLDARWGPLIRYFASQGDGIHLLPFGSSLKCVLVMKGCCKIHRDRPPSS